MSAKLAVSLALVLGGLLACQPDRVNAPGGAVVRQSANTVVTAASVEGWTTKASMPAARWAASAGEINNELYIVGGLDDGFSHVATVHSYNPATNTWTSKAPMPTARAWTSAEPINGVLYVAGGVGLAGILATVEAYDPATNTWTSKAPMPTARAEGVAGVIDGILYVAGGIDGSFSPIATVDAYNPVTNTWTSKAPMPTARDLASGGVIGRMLYVAGGEICCNSVVATVEAYNPATNTWTSKTPMPAARYAASAAVNKGVLYVAGGLNDGFLATVEAYDPRTNTWTSKAPMPTARDVSSAGVVKGILYVVGGQGAGPTFPFLSTVEAYKPGNVDAVQVSDHFTWPIDPGNPSNGSFNSCSDNPQCFWLDYPNGWRDVQPFLRYAFVNKQNQNRYHLGADWNLGSGADDRGLPVYAVADGEVVAVRENFLTWGNIVFVRHMTSFGVKVYTSMYAHVDWNSSGPPPLGHVNKGDPLGMIGNGSDCCGYPYHLHFELREGTSTTPGSGYVSTRTTPPPQGQIDPDAFIAAHR
jgi:N-acetylneuraminic acid mutarotase